MNKVTLCCKNAPYQKAFLLDTDNPIDKSIFYQAEPELINKGVFHCDDAEIFKSYISDIVKDGAKILSILKIDDAIKKPVDKKSVSRKRRQFDRSMNLINIRQQWIKEERESLKERRKTEDSDKIFMIDNALRKEKVKLDRRLEQLLERED